MNDADRGRLRRLLDSLDEAALVALANKGLLRRATKDFEAGGLSHVEEETEVVVSGPDWTVRMPATGPADAADDTRASGVTRHVLAATLYLQSSWRAAEEPVAESTQSSDQLREQLLAISADQLTRWASKSVAATARRLLAEESPAVSWGGGFAVRFEHNEIDVRLVDDGQSRQVNALLDRIVTTAPKAKRREWVAAAILAAWREAGRGLDTEWSAPAAARLVSAASQAPLLRRVRSALETMAATGVAHPSASTVEQFFTLSVSARAYELPRLARLLRSIADQISLIQDRHAKADTERVLHLAAITHALAAATEQAREQTPAHLVGRRARYESAGELSLAGVGAYDWKTASGYEGLTVLLWDASERVFRTWSDSRPVGSPDGFSPNEAYVNGLVWDAAAPARVCREKLLIRGAKGNDQGRLSSVAQDVELSGPTARDSLDFSPVLFHSWEELRGHLRAAHPLGLREVDFASQFVVLQPETWGQRTFDETDQVFTWDLIDKDQSVARLSVPWTESGERKIEFLEAVNPKQVQAWAVVAAVLFTAQGVRFEPVSLLTEGEEHVLNPSFDLARIRTGQSSLLDRLKKKFKRQATRSVLGEEESQQDQLLSLEDLPPRFARVLADVGNELLAIGESGTRALKGTRTDRLVACVAPLKRLGLDELAKAIDDLAGDPLNAATYLQARYVYGLHTQAARLCLEFSGED